MVISVTDIKKITNLSQCERKSGFYFWELAEGAFRWKAGDEFITFISKQGFKDIYPIESGQLKYAKAEVFTLIQEMR